LISDILSSGLLKRFLQVRVVHSFSTMSTPSQPVRQPKSQSHAPKGHGRFEKKEAKASQPLGPRKFDRPIKFIDIGANLLDDMFQGSYRGKKFHDADFDLMLQRGWDAGMDRIIITAGTLKEARQALELCKRDDRLFCTVGVHPTRASQFEGREEKYLADLLKVAQEGMKLGKVVAIGECGLDYDRLMFCPKDVQLKHFEKHFVLAEKTGLPLFLHDRNTGGDFARLIKDNRHRFKYGVVHSFTGTQEELKAHVDLKLHVGINGCSMKTEDNMAAMAKVPLELLMIETDAPWCGIKATHASHRHVQTQWPAFKKEKMVVGELNTVKDRCEPCHIVQVVEAIAGHTQRDLYALADACYANTCEVFFPTLFAQLQEAKKAEEAEEAKEAKASAE